jgi:hypothetical protein
MTGWQNEMAFWQNGKVKEWQVDEIAYWLNELTEYQVDKMLEVDRMAN